MTVLVCSKCKAVKDESLFDRCSALKTGRRPDCKECRAPIQKAWSLKNADKVKIKCVKWAKENPEKSKASQKKYREKNVEKYREALRKWQKNNLAYDAYRKAQMRAAKKLATPCWANKEKILDFYKKAKIIERKTGKKVHVDHIYPLTSEVVCGLHVENNLQLLYAVDNISKKNHVNWIGGVLSL